MKAIDILKKEILTRDLKKEFELKQYKYNIYLEKFSKNPTKYRSNKLSKMKNELDEYYKKIYK